VPYLLWYVRKLNSITTEVSCESVLSNNFFKLRKIYKNFRIVFLPENVLMKRQLLMLCS